MLTSRDTPRLNPKLRVGRSAVEGDAERVTEGQVQMVDAFRYCDVPDAASGPDLFGGRVGGDNSGVKEHAELAGHGAGY